MGGRYDLLGGGGARRYRGSKKRLSRIRITDHLSRNEIILLLIVFIILLVAVPWFAIHGHHH